MSLVDTTDGVLMLRAYDWAFVKPMRKLYYNITITACRYLSRSDRRHRGLGLIRTSWAYGGAFSTSICYLNDNFNSIGFLIIGLFIVSWVGSFILYRWMRLDDFEVAIAPTVSPTLDKEDPLLVNGDRKAERPMPARS